MRIFGEIGIMKKTGMLSKVDNKGVDGLFVGYAENHSGEVYRMLNLVTHKISLTRDVRWLNINYKKYMQNEQNTSTMSDSTSDLKVAGTERSEQKESAKDSIDQNIIDADMDSSTKMVDDSAIQIVTVSSDSSSTESQEQTSKNHRSKLDPYRITRELIRLDVNVDLPPPVYTPQDNQ